MNYDDLQADIFASFWRSNELNKRQAENYAALAIAHMKRHMQLSASEVLIPAPNSCMQGFRASQAAKEAA